MVKTRIYRSELRTSQAANTQRAVLDAAERLFAKEGWSKTTIQLIAATAKVSPETVYSIFGSKREVLLRLVERALRGSEADAPLLQQAVPQALLNDGSPAPLATFAKDISHRLARVAPLIAVVRTAADSDAVARKLYLKLHQGRRNNIRAIIQALADRGVLRPDLSVDAACIVAWRLASPELFLLMTRVEGLSAMQFADALTDSLERLLLPPVI